MDSQHWSATHARSFHALREVEAVLLKHLKQAMDLIVDKVKALMVIFIKSTLFVELLLKDLLLRLQLLQLDEGLDRFVEARVHGRC